MTIEFSKDARDLALASIERYFKDRVGEPIGNMEAGFLLDFVLAEIGPVIFNSAVTAVQKRLAAQVEDLPFEVHMDEFQYWRRPQKPGKG